MLVPMLSMSIKFLDKLFAGPALALDNLCGVKTMRTY